ncbi:hypothetical protein E2C01_051631 [Portunus trituberculatus]|uniref:Uncharacterized protein n=1 Tax=Portunus trituberculatus TaxID=210409 RepID=A0A5B7GJ91_PORTR|nr:hypothetical protein [Portunus trituberculatus]
MASDCHELQRASQTSGPVPPRLLLTTVNAGVFQIRAGDVNGSGTTTISTRPPRLRVLALEKRKKGDQMQTVKGDQIK